MTFNTYSELFITKIFTRSIVSSEALLQRDDLCVRGCFISCNRVYSISIGEVTVVKNKILHIY